MLAGSEQDREMIKIMTYLKDRTEYLTPDEIKVWESVKYLSGSGRTTNNSQIASDTGLSRTKVADITTWLRRRGYLRDVSKGSAYHWRVTGKHAESEHPVTRAQRETAERAGRPWSYREDPARPSGQTVAAVSEDADLLDTAAAHEEAARKAYELYIRHNNRAVELRTGR